MDRLTNTEAGFVTYSGKKNPYDVPLTVGELAGFITADYSPREILEEIMARLAAYEQTGLDPNEVEAMKIAMMGRGIAEIVEIDGVPISRICELAQADKDGRLIICSPTAKEGDAKPSCFYNDNGSDRCLGLASADMDEPIEKCKTCWYCESGYHVE